jgi:hypothetical protein
MHVDPTPQDAPRPDVDAPKADPLEEPSPPPATSRVEDLPF